MCAINDVTPHGRVRHEDKTLDSGERCRGAEWLTGESRYLADSQWRLTNPQWAWATEINMSLNFCMP